MNINPESIKVVGLDAWGTLVEYGHEATKRRQYNSAPMVELLAAHGVEFGSFESFYQVNRRVKDTTERLSEVTGRHIGPLERNLTLALEVGILAADIRRDEFERVTNELLERNEAVLPRLIEPGIGNTLAKLGLEGRKIAVVSNLGMLTAGYMRRSFCELGIGEHLDHELYSDEMNMCKPNPRVFARLCEVAGCGPENVLFIGDNRLADYMGPHEFGMQAIHISSKPSEAEVTAPSVTLALKLAGLVD